MERNNRSRNTEEANEKGKRRRRIIEAEEENDKTDKVG